MSKPSFLISSTLICVWVSSVAWASEQAATPAAVETIDATVRQPRSFGHFIGDVLTQRVLLDTASGKLEPRLPRAERVGVWFERRASRIETADEDGRRWLVLEYQIINAPREVAAIELPGLTIEDASGTREISIPGSPISVAPLTTPVAAEDLSRALRPDLASPQVLTSPIWRKLIGYATACVLVVVAWLAWIGWRNWVARREQPFARAWTELKAMSDRAPEAWQSLHRAFDRTAGRVMQGSTLAALFEAAPHLNRERARIERFYAQSSELFFGTGLPDDALSVHELCRDLRRLERRYE